VLCDVVDQVASPLFAAISRTATILVRPPRSASRMPVMIDGKALHDRIVSRTQMPACPGRGRAATSSSGAASTAATVTMNILQFAVGIEGSIAPGRGVPLMP
jgi:hypothetical protein